MSNKTAATGYPDKAKATSHNSTSIVRCHSLECIAFYYNIEWLGSRSSSNIRNSRLYELILSCGWGNTLVRYNITVGIFRLNYFVIEVVNKHLSFLIMFD